MRRFRTLWFAPWSTRSELLGLLVEGNRVLLSIWVARLRPSRSSRGGVLDWAWHGKCDALPSDQSQRHALAAMMLSLHAGAVLVRLVVLPSMVGPILPLLLAPDLGARPRLMPLTRSSPSTFTTPIQRLSAMGAAAPLNTLFSWPCG